MSDPRFDGEWLLVKTESFVPTDSVPDPELFSVSFRIENEDGAWEEQPGMVIEYADGSGSTRTGVFIGEGDRHGRKPLYQALVELFRSEKLAGATVLRGTLGFGAKSHLHTAQLLRLTANCLKSVKKVPKKWMKRMPS